MITQRNDIRFPVGIDTGLKRIASEANYGRHIGQLIRQVLFTNPGERVNRPEFGCGLRNLLFAPNSDVTASLAQVTVSQALDKWLGSVIKLDEIVVEAHGETLEIKISYTVSRDGERRYLNVEMSV